MTEAELASYCVKMTDMDFGLSRSDVMILALHQDILNSPCIPPSHSHVHQVPIVKSSLIILANWGQYVQN